jgi:uncharacterized membrane protein YGL010W
MLNPDLIEYFQSYADYHRHPMNRLTHKIAIPLIVFQIVAMLDWVRLFTIPGLDLTVTLAHPVYLATISWYYNLDAKLAGVMAVAFAVCFPLAWITPVPVVLVLAVFAWIIQLAGHVIWEKRQPAFVTNLVQMLIGPLFFAAVLTGDWPVKREEA